jgi:transcriptional regulator with XRE-family HTH domain
MKAITILKDLGINVIKAHFSYLNPKSQKTYITYDFTNLKTVKELAKEKKISKSEINRIENKIREFKVKVNLSLLKDFEKHHTIAYINAELNKIRHSYSSTIIADIEK